MDGRPPPLSMPSPLSADTVTTPRSTTPSSGSFTSTPRFKVKLRLGGRPKSAENLGNSGVSATANPAVPSPCEASPHQQDTFRHAHDAAGEVARLNSAMDGTVRLGSVSADPLQAGGATGTIKPIEGTALNPEAGELASVSPGEAVTGQLTPLPPKKRKRASSSSLARKVAKLDRSVPPVTSNEYAEPFPATANVNASGQATPSESRQATPLPVQAHSVAPQEDVFKDKNARPRKWKRGPVSVLTMGGGEMWIFLWSTDQPPTFPSHKQHATINIEAHAELTSSLAGEVPGTPPTVASASTVTAAAVADTQTTSAPSPKAVPVFDPTKPHVCPYGDSLGCMRAFPTKGKLATHILTVHGPKTHACQACPKKFASITQLVRHRKTHENPLGRPAGATQGLTLFENVDQE